MLYQAALKIRCTRLNLRITVKCATELDHWVFDRVKKLFADVDRDEELNARLRQDGIVFFPAFAGPGYNGTRASAVFAGVFEEYPDCGSGRAGDYGDR